MQALCDLDGEFGVSVLVEELLQGSEDVADRSGIDQNILNLLWSFSNALSQSAKVCLLSVLLQLEDRLWRSDLPW